MITKSDCLLLLADIPNSQNITKKLITSGITPEVISYINERRPLDLGMFYEKIRKSYNKGNSKLYINIVNDNLNPSEILTTLSSLQLQILLYGKTIQNPINFYKQSRLDEISSCIYNYSKTFDLTNCQKLLRLIKADLKCMESVSR